MLKCSRANVTYVLTCQHAPRGYVLTCQHALRAYVLTCQHVLRAYVLTCLAISHANVSYVLTYSRANVPLRAYVLINSNNYKKLRGFNDMVYLDFWYFFFFSLWNKTICKKCTTSRYVSRNIYFENSMVHSSIAFTRRKPLMGAMANFVQ